VLGSFDVWLCGFEVAPFVRTGASVFVLEKKLERKLGVDGVALVTRLLKVSSFSGRTNGIESLLRSSS